MASGSTINSTDLSSLRDAMNTILNGTGVHGGYNQSHTVSANPATGVAIDDAYLDSLYSAAAKISNYYNIANPFTAVNAGTTRAPHTPQLGSLAYAHGQPADAACSSESNLDASVRPGACRNGERLRYSRNATHAPATAGLAGQPVCGVWLGCKDNAPPDGHQRHLPAVFHD